MGSKWILEKTGFQRFGCLHRNCINFNNINHNNNKIIILIPNTNVTVYMPLDTLDDNSSKNQNIV